MPPKAKTSKKVPGNSSGSTGKFAAMSNILFAGGHTKLTPKMVARTKAAAEQQGKSKVIKAKFTVQSVDAETLNKPGKIKEDQRWKYPNGIVVRHPNGIFLNPNGVPYTDPKEKEPMARRQQETNFNICINTNKAPKAHQLALAVMSMKKVNTQLASDAWLAVCLRYGPVNKEYELDRYEDIIESVTATGSVEIGPKLKRLHTHLRLRIIHYSQIQINLNVLKESAMRLWNNECERQPTLTGMRMTSWPHVFLGTKGGPRVEQQLDIASITENYIHKGVNFAAHNAPNP